MPHAQPLAEEELRRPHPHRRVNFAKPAEQLDGGDRLDDSGLEQRCVGSRVRRAADASTASSTACASS